MYKELSPYNNGKGIKGNKRLKKRINKKGSRIKHGFKGENLIGKNLSSSTKKRIKNKIQINFK